MPANEAETDYVCAECGKVTAGPHQGERVPKAGRTKMRYKGVEISHGFCPNCALRHVNEHRHRRGLPPKESL